MQIQSLYQKAIKFAAAKHAAQNQTIPGTNLPYVVHLSNVAMEILIASFHSENFDLGFAVQVALLHDTLEDTSATFAEYRDWETDRKSTRLNSSHITRSRMPSSA